MPITTLDTVNEGQTGYITLTFRDEEDVIITPSSFTYLLNDLVTGTQLATGTVTSPGSPYVFTLTPVMNIICTEEDDLEEHVLTIDATYEATKHVTGDYHFNVANLEFLLT